MSFIFKIWTLEFGIWTLVFGIWFLVSLSALSASVVFPSPNSLIVYSLKSKSLLLPPHKSKYRAHKSHDEKQAEADEVEGDDF